MAEETRVTKNTDLRSMIQSDVYKKQFAMVLPKHMTADRMVRVALTALIKTPKLNTCTPASVMQCLLDCSAMGLEPDGRRAHLIPYGDQCTIVVDYKGIAELVMRSGIVSYIHADVVCENDEFEENLGQVTKHKINRRADRGKPYAVYTYVRMKDGTDSFCVMGMKDVDKIRLQHSKQWKGLAESPDWYAKKTCFRQHSKWLPLSPEIKDAIEKDSDNVSTVIPDFIGDAADAPTVDSGAPVSPDSVEPPKKDQPPVRKVVTTKMKPTPPPAEPEPVDDGEPVALEEDDDLPLSDPEPEEPVTGGGPLASPRRR